MTITKKGWCGEFLQYPGLTYCVSANGILFLWHLVMPRTGWSSELSLLLRECWVMFCALLLVLTVCLHCSHFRGKVLWSQIGSSTQEDTINREGQCYYAMIFYCGHYCSLVLWIDECHELVTSWRRQRTRWLGQLLSTEWVQTECILMLQTKNDINKLFRSSEVVPGFNLSRKTQF